MISKRKVKVLFQEKGKKAQQTKPKVVNSVQQGGVLAKAFYQLSLSDNLSWVLFSCMTTPAMILWWLFVDYNFINPNNLFSYYIDRHLLNKDESMGKGRKS